jgi:hypothetical protein
MASRGVRRIWRADFKARGTENVRQMIAASDFSEEKIRYARRWLWRRDNALTLAGIAIGALVAIVALLRFFVDWSRSG